MTRRVRRKGYSRKAVERIVRAAMRCCREEIRGVRFHWQAPDWSCKCGLCVGKRALEKALIDARSEKRRTRP